MSSHHVVRDEQEPALLILNPLIVNDDVLKGLLEWNPTVIVTKDSWREVNDSGIKIDIILISETSLSDTFKIELDQQAPLKILQYPKNESAIIAALNRLTSRNYTAINIIANKSRQKEIRPLVTPFTNRLDITFYHQQFKSYFIENGKFEKWARKEQQFLIMDRSNPIKIRLTGLTEDNNLSNPLFTAIDNGKITIDANRQPFWLTEEL